MHDVHLRLAVRPDLVAALGQGQEVLDEVLKDQSGRRREEELLYHGTMQSTYMYVQY